MLDVLTALPVIFVLIDYCRHPAMLCYLSYRAL